MLKHARRTVTLRRLGVAVLAALLASAASLSRAATPKRSDDQSAPAKKTAVTGQVTVKRDFTYGFDELEKQLKARTPSKYIAQSVRPDMYPQPSDRDVADVAARRTEALLEDVAYRAGTGDLAQLRKDLAALKAHAASLRKEGKRPGRDELAEFRKLDWRISKANGLINFDKVLFITRHKSRRSHMCDQFLGVHARGGGGLYVLSGAFGDSPKVTDVLARSVVQNGRLKGKRLAGGAVLSPDLSYDGKTVVFAYAECGKGTNKARPGWAVDQCFHLFRVNVDGTNLVQLTDGELNDFDPCWLPNGRICFISERRGGFGRCHGSRDAPSYTLASIRPDGGDLVLLSYHESNEWHPSVTNDGQIIYTRWDYVDRGTNQAHHPWITSLDGRDPRAIHGNYPLSRRGLADRPWMEMDIRAIPNSTRFVATTAGHHGQAYGSFVILDVRGEDDGRMSQLKRLTPEAPFPESEGGRDDYATAWPLDENYYLCARRNGLYLIDVFGGRHLLYHSKDVPCLSPIPLRRRPLPHLVPHQTAVGLPVTPGGGSEADPTDGRKAAVALMNVYDALLPWPTGTRIKELRIIQIVSRATRSAPQGTGRTNIREVLGTVPVETDGSAYFLAPTNMDIYFQALDERGLAVQSMRSATYVHPGEQLTCRGCHEPRHRAPPVTGSVRLALRRKPSAVRPEAEGSHPFDFNVLVKPLFDSKCNGCHAKQKKRVVSMDRRTAMKYVPYFVSPKPYEPSRTTPGKFGAMGSKLLKYLDKSHYDVKLTPAEFRRITLWVDANAPDRGFEKLSPDQRIGLAEFAAP